jgi:hypothetical protein
VIENFYVVFLRFFGVPFPKITLFTLLNISNSSHLSRFSFFPFRSFSHLDFPSFLHNHFHPKVLPSLPSPAKFDEEYLSLQSVVQNPQKHRLMRESGSMWTCRSLQKYAWP